DPTPVYLKGQLDELRLYQRALSEVEMAMLANEFTSTALPHSPLPSQGAFPNPTRGILHLPGNWTKMDPVYLLDLQGRILAELEVRDRQVALGDRPPGVYVLRGRNGLRSLVQRIVVE
ncbi:MAG: T9SS type A sorting domain-containing protein, partial [Bacteroidota bacterium]